MPYVTVVTVASTPPQSPVGGFLLFKSAFKDVAVHSTPATSEREALGKRASQFRPNPNAIAKPIPGVLSTLDLFAGAGGFATALHRIARQYGFRVLSTLLNHWHVALENARENLGEITVINASIQDVEPLQIIPTGYLDLLVASPECVYFSSARGAKPIQEQRRSSAAELLRFLEDLYVETFVMENVSEMVDWGPLDENMRPVKERKGEYFKAFIKALKNLGYDVAYSSLVASNFGDPTTRKRLFLCAQKGGRRAVMPTATHSKNGAVPGTLPWVPARRIINFDIKGLSIFSRRHPHVTKTLRRISIGFADQCERAPLANAYVTAAQRFSDVTEIYHKQIALRPTAKTLGRKLTKDEANLAREIKSTASQQHRFLVEEAFREPVAILRMEDLLLGQTVEPTLQNEQRLMMGTLNMVNPVVTKLFGTTNAISVDGPLDTITAGGSTYGLAKPVPDEFLVTVNHGETTTENGRHAALSEPLGTITSKGSQGIVEPFCLRANASDTSAFKDAVTPIDRPLRTITTKNNLSIIVPDATILPQHCYATDSTATPDAPLPTITAISRHGLVSADIQELTGEIVTPFVDCYNAGATKDPRKPRSVDQPLATQTAEPRFGLVQGTVANRSKTGGEAQPTSESPSSGDRVSNGDTGRRALEGFILSHGAPKDDQLTGSRTRGFDEPIATTTCRGGGYLAEPNLTLPESVLVSQHYGFGNANPNLDEPLVTATTAGCGYIANPAIVPVEAVIIPQQRGSGVDADPLDRPLRTLTTANGTGVAMPEGFVTPNFGERVSQKPRTHSLGEPLPTATSHGAGMLVTAELAGIEPGKPWILVDGIAFQLDILYRMLLPSELLAAMSFTDESNVYKFKKNASVQSQVRMIGNAVPVKTSMKVLETAMAYRFRANEVTIGVAA